MNLPGFYSLGGALLALLFIPLIILYFLKLKRPRQEIPSLALWRQVVNDQRVNSPFQKFKRNILLLLQALLLAMLVLAAMQPFLNSGVERAQYLPVLVDCSASMAALDKPGGRSRLELAKEEVETLIDDLLPDQRMSLIAVSSSARGLTEFTDNKRLLREALEKLEVADVPARLEDGLRMTQALARTVPLESVLIYSDGNFPAEVDFELPFEINFQKLPGGGPNIGVTNFNARRSKTSKWDVFVRVASSELEQTAGDIELLQDGEPVADETVVLEPGESERLRFTVDSDEATSLQVRLKPDGFDSLPTDDVSWLDLPEPRPLRVFCHPELEAWRFALGVIPDLELSPEEETTPSGAKYDVYIADELPGDDVEAAVRVMVGAVPPDAMRLVSVGSGVAEVVDWDRSSPLLQHVNVADVQIVELPTSADGVGEGDYEQLGYQVLAHARSGPLILKRREGPEVTYWFLFHTSQSTLPYRVGFPVMVANVLQVAMTQASLSEIRGQRTGLLPPQTLLADRTYRVTDPAGDSRDYESNRNGVLSGVPAPQVGRYKVLDGGTLKKAIGVGLLDAVETSLSAVDEIQFNETSVAATDEEITNDQPLWRYFAIVGFVVLLIEWWYFQKRPVGPAT